MKTLIRNAVVVTMNGQSRSVRLRTRRRSDNHTAVSTLNGGEAVFW